MIVINELVINNYLSFGEGVSLRLDTDAVTQLIGANGAGKSSIHLIIEEILFNKNSKKISKKNLKNRYSDADYYGGSITFTRGSTTYVVTKEVKSSTKLSLTADGKDISGHTASQTYKLIEDILGMDFTTFSKFVNQSLVSSLDFLALTDAKKKEFLVSFLGLTDYIAAGKKAKENVKNLSTKLSVYEDSIERLTNKVEDKRKELEKLKSAELPSFVENPEVPKDGTSDLSQELRIAELEYKESLDAFEAYLEQKTLYEEAVKSLPSNKKKKEMLESQVAALQKAKLDYEEKVDEATQAFSNESARIVSLEREFKAAEKKFRDFNNSFAATCYACGQSIDVEDKQFAADQLADQAMKAQAEYRKAENASNLDALSEARVKLIKERKENALELDMVKGELNRHSSAVDSAETFINQFESKEFSCKEPPVKPDLDFTRELLDRQKEEYNTALEAYQKILENNEKIKLHEVSLKRSKDQLSDFDSLLQEEERKWAETSKELSVNKAIAEALSNKGIINNKIASLMKKVSEYINNYLKRLSSGRYSLEFSVSEAKLVITVYYRGTPVEIGSLSSGEYAIVQVSTLLGIRQALASFTNNRTNLMFLDEVISVLDDGVKPLLLEMLSEERELNCFIVSHSYRHPFAKALYVIKEDNISSISEG